MQVPRRNREIGDSRTVGCQRASGLTTETEDGLLVLVRESGCSRAPQSSWKVGSTHIYVAFANEKCPKLLFCTAGIRTECGKYHKRQRRQSANFAPKRSIINVGARIPDSPPTKENQDGFFQA